MTIPCQDGAQPTTLRVLPFLLPPVFILNQHPRLETAQQLDEIFPYQEDRRKIIDLTRRTSAPGIDPTLEWPSLLQRYSKILYGLENLLSQVNQLYPDYIQTAEIMEIIKKAAGDPVVSPTQFDNLGQIIVQTRLPTATALEIMDDLPGLRIQLPAAIKKPYDILRHLAFIPPNQPGKPVLFDYVRQLAQRSDDQPEKSALNSWLDSVTTRIDSPEEAPSQTPRRNTVPYLPILVEEAGGGHYTVRAWLRRSGYDDKPLFDHDDPVSREDLPKLFDCAVRSVENNHSTNISQLVIEVFLPDDLLSLDIDEWRLGFSGQDMDGPIGAQYAVVTRLLRRAQMSVCHDTWRLKWDHLAMCDNNVNCHISEWFEEPLEDVKLYYRWLNQETPGSVRIGFALDSTTNDGRSIIEGIYAGVPIALWSRTSSAHGDEFRQIVDCILANTPISQLPKKVQDLRRRIAERPHVRQPGQGIVLLYDDPSSVPPNLGRKLSAP
ncbi:hypothetical protein [Frankia sp. CiP3]|uniref:VMAP-C domain-containing protein n=1 Tax=Frankia sp. CiP3 TaxID=2880971 RepID=UPI001EF6BE2B|nr:hypothetical protein [Frankia sp. CiP3]